MYGLRTMMSRTHGDALLVEKIANLLRADAVYYERQDARLFAGRADDSQAGNAGERQNAS